MKKNLSLVLLYTLLITGCNSIPSQRDSGDSAEALYKKGVALLANNHSKVNERTALSYFKASSEKGYAPAYNALGVAYEKGIAVKANKQQAVEYYQVASALDLAPAQYNLAILLYEIDPTNPLMNHYLQKAIAQNSPEALNLLGRIQLDNREYAKAFQSFSKSAQQNANSDALFFLGLMKAEGKGTSRNTQQAFSYYQRAAQLMHPEAQFIVGSMYLNGDGTLKDHTKAAQYFEQAATQGHTKALVNYAIMLAKGDGVKKDTQKAAQLFKIAANRGDQQAVEVMQSLNKIQ